MVAVAVGVGVAVAVGVGVGVGVGVVVAVVVAVGVAVVSNAERTKGRRAEQEVARIFRAHGFEVQRTPNSGGLHVKGDVIGVPGFHIEVKRQETLRLPLWRRQAAAECGDCIPVVVYRRNNEPWRVSMRARDWPALRSFMFRELAFGGTLTEYVDAPLDEWLPLIDDAADAV